jgi:putative aldouronate transport system substrate-binding protein
MDGMRHYVDDRTGRVQFFAMQPEFRDWLVAMNRFFNEGLLNPMFGSGQEGQAANDLMRRNQVGSHSNNPGDADNMITFARAAGAVDPVYVWFFTPQDRNGRIRWMPHATARNTLRVGITKDARNPGLAMEFMNFVWGHRDGVRLNLIGIEGRHWNYVNGVPVLVDDIARHPQFDVAIRLRQQGAFAFFDIQTREFNVARGAVQHQYMAGIEYIYANQDRLWPTLPDLIATDAEQQVIVQFWPDIVTYIDEMTVRFIMGTEPLANFNAFQQRLEAMGIARVAAQHQSMYDRFRAAMR